MRILHLRSTSGLYGADRALLTLAGATPTPFTPIVGSLARPGVEDALADESERRGFSTLRLASSARMDFSVALRLADEARARRAALLHAHDYKSLAIAVLAARHARLPVVATFHGDTGENFKVCAYEACARLLVNVTAGAACVSAVLAQMLRRWAPLSRVVHIPNGLVPVKPPDARERAEARAHFGLTEEFTLAVVGRLSPEKGLAVLLKALRALPRPPTVLFAGDGPLRRELTTKAAGLPVRFLGFLHDTRALYAAADAVVLPSLTEGLPLAALEGMAHGRPVIASAVGELPQVLGNGGGALVPPGSAAALAQVLQRWQESSSERESCCTEALRRIHEHYSADAMADAYLAKLWVPALEAKGVKTVQSSA